MYRNDGSYQHFGISISLYCTCFNIQILRLICCTIKQSIIYLLWIHVLALNIHIKVLLYLEVKFSHNICSSYESVCSWILNLNSIFTFWKMLQMDFSPFQQLCVDVLWSLYPDCPGNKQKMLFFSSSIFINFSRNRDISLSGVDWLISD